MASMAALDQGLVWLLLLPLAGAGSPALGLRHSPYVIQLEGGDTVGEYFTMVHVGEPPLPFRVQIDTGSSTLFVAAAGCMKCSEHATQLYDVSQSTSGRRIGCDDAMCKVATCQSPFCPSTCAASKIASHACCSARASADCGFGVQYAGGSSVQGALVQDTIRLGSLTANATFGRTLEQGGPWHGVVDGIFGMAMAALDCTPTCTKPLLADLVAQHSLDDAFSMCLSDASGWLVVGGVDAQFRSGPFVTTPMVKSSGDKYLFYRIEFTGLALGAHPVTMPRLSDAFPTAIGQESQSAVFSTAIVDSGTTLLLLPTELFVNMVNMFKSSFAHLDGVLGRSGAPSAIDVAGVDGTQTCLGSAPISGEAQGGWPLLRLQVGPNLELEIPAYLYFTRTGNVWCFGIQPVASGAAIFGDTVLRGFYVAYDHKKELIGFAPSNAKKCGFPGAGGVNGPPASRDDALPFLALLNSFVPFFAISFCSSGCDTGFSQLD